jgi:hypothetical protein
VEVQPAHPYGLRAIAAARVKTDRIDERVAKDLSRTNPAASQKSFLQRARYITGDS